MLGTGLEHADRQRAQAVGVAEGDDAVLGHDDDREGAAQAREHVGDRVLDLLGRVGGDHRGDDLRVGGRAERDAALEQLVVQLERVDQVAVVRERDLAARAVGALRALHRLRVLPGVGAGGGVAHVADRELAGERAQVVLAEHLVDEAELAAGDDVPAAVGRGDARRLLAAVLEGVQREVRQTRHLVTGRVQSEHSALVARSVTHHVHKLAGGHANSSRSASCAAASSSRVSTSIVPAVPPASTILSASSPTRPMRTSPHALAERVQRRSRGHR